MAARVLILGLFFLVAARLLEGTEYLRVPATLIDDETASVLRDAGALTDLRRSEADVAAGRTTSLDELRRELGRG